MGASCSTNEELGHQLSSEQLKDATKSAESLGGHYVASKLEPQDRQVVLKVFKDVESHEVPAFKRRVARLCGLDLHLHLLLPMGWGVSKSKCYVVYDQLDSVNAEKRLQVSRNSGKPFLWADRLRVAAAVASAVSHLRSCLLGSPHLNLKLSSVLFDRTGQVKLADLGFEGRSFEGKGDLQSTKAQAGSLASQQVAELQDLGFLLFELLMMSSEAAAAAAKAAQQVDPQRPLDFFQRRDLDASAAWPVACAQDLALTAQWCCAAEAAGSVPPPGMTEVAGALLHLCQRSRNAEGGAAFGGFELAFECIFSNQLEVQSLTHEKRFWHFPPMAVGHEPGPWPVGRQHQVELFVQLVPDRRLCSSIGRTHFELWPQDAPREGSWFGRSEKSALRLVPLSQNPIMVDGRKAAYPSEEEVLIFDGSKVSFSFQDEVFLTLQFHLGHERIEAAKAKQTQQTSEAPTMLALGGAPAAAASYALQCEELLGESADNFSKEERRIPLSEGVNLVGRMSHPGYFDKLQRGAPQGRPLLQFISRRHLQVTALPDADTPPNKRRFEVVNWSNNPISVAGHELYEGQKQTVQAGDTIELLGEDGRGGLVPYLVFRILWTGASRSTSSLASRSTLLPAGAIFKDRFKENDFHDRREPRPPFQLILAGTAVVKGLPHSWRAVDGTPGGLTVGRAHQRELHEKALVEGVVEYISRDHFSIKTSRDGNFSVMPLSQNPMWHSRGGRLQLLQPGHLPVRLQHADVLVLYTGADDASHPDGPGSLGSLQWIFKIITGP